MPSKKNTQSKSSRRPLSSDDFQIISHINSIIESRLQQAGILTFEELASLTPEQIFKKVGRLTGFTLKQITDQDWVGQARKLSEKKDPSNGLKDSEGFILNLFLNKQKLVHSTQILHVNSDEGAKWNGWDSTRLQDFIINHSGIVLPNVEIVQAEALEIQLADKSPAGTEELTGTTIQSETLIAESDAAPRLEQPQVAKPEIAFRAFEMISSTSGSPGKFLHMGEPFELRLAIDTEKNLQEVESAMNYTAAISAKNIETSQRTSLGAAQGVIASADEAIVVKIPQQNLAPGTYRLEAAMTIARESQTVGTPVQARTFLQVF